MAEPRPRKLARIANLKSRLPYISQNALESILNIAAHEPLPSGSRMDIRAARDHVAFQQTPYGRLHQVIELGSPPDDIKLEVQHPAAMLYHACAISTSFAHLVRRAAAAKPPSVTSPWTLILYSDEISPGNQLSHQNDRKVWGVYWSILEFGSAALSKEDSEAMHDIRSKSYLNLCLDVVGYGMYHCRQHFAFFRVVQVRI